MTKETLRAIAGARVAKLKTAPTYSTENLQQLTFELQVHQEELVVQNEELRRAHLDLQSQKVQYADLYDFAPVGYLTLNPTGMIVGANLMAATMLKRPRANLIGTNLASFCTVKCRDDLANYVERLLSTFVDESRELQFESVTGNPIHFRLDGTAVAPP